MASFYCNPPTILQVITETCDLLDKYRKDQSVSKTDVIDTMEEKLSILSGKYIAFPTSTSFAMFQTNLSS